MVELQKRIDVLGLPSYVVYEPYEHMTYLSFELFLSSHRSTLLMEQFWRFPVEMSNTVAGRNPANQMIGTVSHYFQGFIHPRWCFSHGKSPFVPRKFLPKWWIFCCYVSYLWGESPFPGFQWLGWYPGISSSTSKKWSLTTSPCGCWGITGPSLELR